MPIKIKGDDRSYPGVYDALIPWLRMFLGLSLGATEPVIDLLATWISDGQTRVFPTWADAIDHAKLTLGANAGEFPVKKDSLPIITRMAARITQEAIDLTGAATGGLIDEYSGYMKDDSDTLLAEAWKISPQARTRVGPRDVPELLRQSGATVTLADWEAVIACYLAWHPLLVFKRPRILVAGSTELYNSVIVRLKPDERISATCELKAQVGDVPVQAIFATNSGEKGPIIMEYRYALENAKMTTAKEQVFVEPIYETFKVTTSDRLPTPRLYDSDKKLFDAVHDLLLRVCQNRDVALHSVTGTLTMTTEIRMCTSCYLVALQFLTNFPSLTVTVGKIDR